MEENMTEQRIEHNPSFQKLKKEIAQLKKLRMLLPIMRLLGVDTSKIKSELSKIKELENQLNELISFPDEFNDIFSDHGWILSETINMNIAKEAIRTYHEHGIEQAEDVLVDYYSPDWVEDHLVLLKFLPEFKERVYLAEKACEDYKAGRYYASVLVTILLIDGWVNDLNIVEFQRRGFYAEDAKLVAWNSITAHPNGLVKLQKLFRAKRQQTRTEKITIPYRNGIVHGMDLGFDNKIVAAKNWAALFAIRDWVLKVRNEELEPQPVSEEDEKTLSEIIVELAESQENIQKLRSWEPRQIIIGNDHPKKGKPEDYEDNTPERMLVIFLDSWKQNNYGFMANCYAPMFNKKPFEIRQEYSDKILLDYELISIKDKASSVADIRVKAKLKIGDIVKSEVYKFRLILNTTNGESAYLPNENTTWGICNRKID